MRFSKWVFTGAGIWGLLVVPPLFFLLDSVSRQYPPAITHPEYYYGFASVTSAWQVAFLVMAANPVRYRALMPVAVLEKFGWVATLTALYLRNRMAPSLIPFGAVDMLLGVLFAVAFVRTAPARKTMAP